jgi:hypothetical protein
MAKRITTAIVVLALAAGLSAQKKADTSLPTQQIGQTVDVPLTGEIANGAFTLSGTVEGAKEPTTIEIKGKLTDEGTLDGTVAMQGHDMPYTAERLKERK